MSLSYMSSNQNTVYINLVFSCLIFFSILFSYIRNDFWINELTLWHDIASKSGSDVRVRNNFGGHLKDNGYLDRALVELFFVIENSPDVYEAYNNIGLIYRDKKEYSRALGYILKSIEIKPNRFQMQYNVAVLYEDMGLLDDALYRYRVFLSLVPRAYEYQIKYALNRIKVLEGR